MLFASSVTNARYTEVAGCGLRELLNHPSTGKYLVGYNSYLFRLYTHALFSESYSYNENLPESSRTTSITIDRIPSNSARLALIQRIDARHLIFRQFEVVNVRVGGYFVGTGGFLERDEAKGSKNTGLRR